MREPDHLRPRRQGLTLPQRVGIGVGAVLVLVLLAGVWLGWSAVQARQELNQAQALLPTLRTQLAGQDLAGARTTAVQISGHAAEARRLTGDPLWRVAGLVPVAGHNLRTVTTMSAAADELSRDVLLPVIDEAGGLDVSMLTPSSGGVDLALIESKSATVSHLGARLEQIVTEVEDTPDSGLIGPVATARTSFLTQVQEVDAQVSALDTAMQLLPGMLGGDGPRTYLVLFQSTDVARAPDTTPGAFAVLRADAGALTLAGLGGPGDLGGPAAPPPGAASPDALPPWSGAAGRYRERYAAATGEQVDGVIAADPMVLSGLMALESTVGTNGEQSGSAVVAAALARITSGSTDPVALVSVLRRGVGEGRLLLWSAHPQEQAILSGTALDGPAPAPGAGSDG